MIPNHAQVFTQASGFGYPDALSGMLIHSFGTTNYPSNTPCPAIKV